VAFGVVPFTVEGYVLVLLFGLMTIYFRTASEQVRDKVGRNRRTEQ